MACHMIKVLKVIKLLYSKESELFCLKSPSKVTLYVLLSIYQLPKRIN